MSDSLQPHGLQPVGQLCHGILQARTLEWGQPFPLPGGLPDTGTEPRSPALQADSLPSESPEESYCLDLRNSKDKLTNDA